MDMKADHNPDSNADNAPTLFHNAAPTPTIGEDNITADVANADGSTLDDDLSLWKTIAETAAELGVNEKRIRRRLNADNADNPDKVQERTQTVTRQTVTGERDAAVLAPSYIEQLRADFAPSANVVAKPDNADSGNAAGNVAVSELMPRSDHVPDSAQLDLIERHLAEIQAFNSGQILEAMRQIQETNRALSEIAAAQNERLEAIQAAQIESEASRARDAEKAREDAKEAEARWIEAAQQQARIVIEYERLREENDALKNRKWWQFGRD